MFRQYTLFACGISHTAFQRGRHRQRPDVKAGYKAQKLPAYLKEPPPPPAPTIDFPKIDKELVNTNFFEYLDFALQFAPAQEKEKEVGAQLGRIGVGAGKTFNFKDLPLEQKLEVGLGMKEGDRKVEEAVAHAGKAINGWRVSSLAGDSAFFNGDWLKRALPRRRAYTPTMRRKPCIHSRAWIAMIGPSTAATTITRSHFRRDTCRR